jgi:nitrate reductase gamma subunit
MRYVVGFIWGVFPYICLVVMIVGTLYRYQDDQLRWTSKSSELLEKKLLIIGSVSFHIGILFVFVGHILGLLIPIGFYNAIGISSELYHILAIVLGGLSGLIAFIGISILLYRRIAVACVRVDTDPSDYIVDGMLWIVVLTGLAFTLGYNLLNGPYEYRTTVGVWIRGVLTLHPDVALMAGVPLVLQVHMVLAFLLFGISPFTRLVHIYSFPIAYLTRAPLLYRARYGYSYGRERQAQPLPPSSRQAPPWVTPPAAQPERQSLLEPVDHIEHVLMHVTEPVHWLWRRPRAPADDQLTHAVR